MEQLGKYTLLRKLGDGGMAEVYLAEVQGPLGFTKRVALKRIHRHLTADRTFVDSLINEARLGGHLNHHNIVQTLDFGQEGEFTYVAMEYVPGVTLGQVLSACWRRGEALPPAVCLQLCIPIADALEYAHTATDSQGAPLHMIHRDLKPSNILISPHGAVKLADFGVARASSNVEQTELAGSIKGTIHYMSPEQANGVLELDGRADLFSLGVILYELLSNERLYSPGAYLSVLKRVQEGMVGEALARLRLKPAGELLGPVLERALARYPAQRFSSAHAMSEALHKALDVLVQTQPSPGIRSLFAFPEVSMLLQPGDETSAGGRSGSDSSGRGSSGRGASGRSIKPPVSAVGVRLGDTGPTSMPPVSEILLPDGPAPEEDPGLMETRAQAPEPSPARKVLQSKPGDVLSGRYRLLERIGQGGMGEVFRAEQLQLGRAVAVKLLAPADAGAGRQAFEQRFLEEAARSARLQHPNIVTIYDYGQSSDGRLYLVMEYLEGESLHTRLEREGAQSLDKVLNLGRQVCTALAEAHAHGIIHRDVTPANLFLCQRGTVRDAVKMLDFGLAQQASAEVGEATTQGIRAGSPAYMSPEQVMGEPLTPASDLYALGLVLYQMLTGKLPFDAADTMTAFYAHLQEPPPPPSQRVAGVQVPARLEQLILQCLAKKAEDRPASALEIASVLEEVADARRRVPLNALESAKALAPVESPNPSTESGISPAAAAETRSETAGGRGASASAPWLWMVLGVLGVLLAGLVGAWLAGAFGSAEKASAPVSSPPVTPIPAVPAPSRAAEAMPTPAAQVGNGAEPALPGVSSPTPAAVPARASSAPPVGGERAGKAEPAASGGASSGKSPAGSGAAPAAVAPASSPSEAGTQSATAEAPTTDGRSAKPEPATPAPPAEKRGAAKKSGTGDLKGWDAAPQDTRPATDPKRPKGDIRNPFDN